MLFIELGRPLLVEGLDSLSHRSELRVRRLELPLRFWLRLGPHLKAIKIKQHVPFVQSARDDAGCLLVCALPVPNILIPRTGTVYPARSKDVLLLSFRG